MGGTGFALPRGLRAGGRRFLGSARASQAQPRLQVSLSRGNVSAPWQGSDGGEQLRTAAIVPVGGPSVEKAVGVVWTEVIHAERGLAPSQEASGRENSVQTAHAMSVPAQVAKGLSPSVRPAQTSRRALRDSNRPFITVHVPSAAARLPTPSSAPQPPSANVLPAPERKQAARRRKRLRPIALSGSEGDSECSGSDAEPCRPPARTRRKVSDQQRLRMQPGPHAAGDTDRLPDRGSSDSGAAVEDAEDIGGSCVESDDAEPAPQGRKATAKRARTADGKPTVAELRQRCAAVPAAAVSLHCCVRHNVLTGSITSADTGIRPCLRLTPG